MPSFNWNQYQAAATSSGTTSPTPPQRSQFSWGNYTVSPSIPAQSGNAVTNALDSVGRGAVQGVLDFAKAPYNLAIKAQEALGVPNVSNANLWTADATQGAADPMLAKISELGPTLAAAPATGGASIGEGALNGALMGGLFGAGGAALNPNNSLGQIGGDALLGAATGGALGAATNAIIPQFNNAINNLRAKSLQPGSPLNTPQDVAQINSQIGSAPVPLGEVINSKGLRSTGDALANVPFSGMAAKQQAAVGASNDAVQNAVNQLGLPGDLNINNIDQSAVDALKAQKAQNMAVANGYYSKANDIASKLNVSIYSKPNFNDALKGVMDSYEGSTPNTPLANFLNSAKFAQISQPFIKPSYYGQGVGMSFNDAQNLYRTLGDQMSNAYSGGDASSARLYGQLRQGLDQDLNDTVSANGNEALKDAFDTARSYYAKNVAPFGDNTTVNNLINDSGNPATLSTALSKQETQPMLGLLDQPTKSLLALQQLKAATPDLTGDTSIDFNKLMQNYGKMPVAARNRLLTGDQQDALNTASQFANVTSRQNAQVSAVTNGSINNIGDALKLGAAKAAALGVPITRPLTNALTSPIIRQAYANGANFQTPAWLSNTGNYLARTPYLLSPNTGQQ